MSIQTVEGKKKLLSIFNSHGEDKRDRTWRGGGDYFKYFHQRRALIRGRRLIEGSAQDNNSDNRSVLVLPRLIPKIPKSIFSLLSFDC